MEHTLFLGLDVHKKTISVATVEGRASADVRFYGTIANTPVAIRSLQEARQRWAAAASCYEAGPWATTLHRLSTRLGHRCDVVAPSLIPRKGRRQGQDRSARCDDAGANVAGRSVDGGVGS